MAGKSLTLKLEAYQRMADMKTCAVHINCSRTEQSATEIRDEWVCRQAGPGRHVPAWPSSQMEAVVTNIEFRLVL